MTSGLGGILLPETVLSSSWFAVLATVVAFNTIVYVGLTLAKLIPLPEQFHPTRVRRWLRAVGIDPDKESAMNSIQPHEELDPTNPYENIRNDVARRTIPAAFSLVGALVVLISIGAFFARTEDQIGATFVDLLGGLIFLVLGQLLTRRQVTGRTLMWTWAIASVALVFMLISDAFREGFELPLLYAFIVLTAFPVVTLAWRPAITGAAVMFIGLTFACLAIPGSEDSRLVVAAFAAGVIGLALLRIRMISLDALADAQARSAAIASTDPLTLTLTRHGLRSLMPSLGAIAARVDEQVTVMYVDINELKSANDAYGSSYGDEVLQAVAIALREHVRAGDLIARWNGDEFLVAGVGNRADADEIAARVQESVRLSGINLGRWPTTVKVGTAAGDPQHCTFEDLVNEATVAATGRSIA